MHDSFAVIRWGAAGIGPGAAGLLWSESVAAEVVVFFIIGRPLLDRLGPADAAALKGEATTDADQARTEAGTLVEAGNIGAEVEAARQRIARAAGVKAEAVRITIDFGVS